MALYELKKVSEETFVSEFEKDTREEALGVLAGIRARYPTSAGWIEYDAGAEQLSNGKWRAYRHHALFTK